MENQEKELELKVQGITLGTLTTNAKVILDAVKVKLAGYVPENYTDSNIQVAKDDKAMLNATAKKLNDERIRLEREFMKPFDEFKLVVTETTDLIKSASAKIDAIVKIVDDREKEEKRKKIDELFSKTEFNLVPFDRIFQAQWLNKTVTLKKIEAEIKMRIEKIESDLVVLDKIGEPDAKVYYLNCLDLTRAMAEADRIKQNRERLAEIEAKKNQLINEEKKESIELPVSSVIQEKPVENVTAEKRDEMLTFTLRLTATKEKLSALKRYIDANGIAYEKV